MKLKEPGDQHALGYRDRCRKSLLPVSKGNDSFKQMGTGFQVPEECWLVSKH